MPPIRFPDGNVVAFPDGTPKETIDQYYQQNFAPRENRLAQAATLAGRFMNARQPAPQSTMPTLAGTNFAFGNQQGVTAVMNAEQNALQDNLRAKMEQERMIQQETEAEKSRAAALKLEQIRHKNDLAEADRAFRNNVQLQKFKGRTVGNSQTGFKHVYTDPETGKEVEVSLPPAPKQPKLITKYDEKGNAIRVEDAPNLNLGQKPQSRMSIASQIQLRKALDDVEASPEEKNMIFQEAMNTGILPNIDMVSKDKTKQYMTVTHEDGSQTIEEKAVGKQVRPPKAEARDPFQYLQKTFGVNWKKGDKQTLANALGQAGFDEQQIKAALGEDVTKDKYLWFIDSSNYKMPQTTLPQAAPRPAPQAGPLASGYVQPQQQGLVPKVYKGQRGMYNPQTQEFFPDKVN